MVELHQERKRDSHRVEDTERERRVGTVASMLHCERKGRQRVEALEGTSVEDSEVMLARPYCLGKVLKDDDTAEQMEEVYCTVFVVWAQVGYHNKDQKQH